MVETQVSLEGADVNCCMINHGCRLLQISYRVTSIGAGNEHEITVPSGSRYFQKLKPPPISQFGEGIVEKLHKLSRTFLVTYAKEEKKQSEPEL